MVELINVSKRYKDNVLFENVSFHINCGLIFLRGDSGCGKSTLLNIIYGIDRCEGKVRVDGSISYMNQDGSLFDDKTVYDNLMVDKGDFDGYLEGLGLSNKKYCFVEELSLGERKRVDFVKCVSKESDIYLLDEPFAYLDEINKYKVLDILRELSKDKLVIVATHELLNECDSYIEIAKGKVSVTNISNKEIKVSNSRDKWYRYVWMERKSIFFRSVLFLFVMLSSVFVSSRFRYVPKYDDINMNVYSYKCGNEYCRPSVENIRPYLDENSSYRDYIELELVSISEVYVKGERIEEFLYIATDGEYVGVNDVFNGMYKEKVIHISVDKVLYEESVEHVYNDNCVYPVVYIPYDKYASYCHDDRFIVINNPVDIDGELERVDIYPLIDSNNVKSINSLVNKNKLIVSVSMYGIWLLFIVFYFEKNVKFYKNVRLNISSKSMIKCLVVERLLMFLLCLLFSDWYVWFISLIVEILFMKVYLDQRLMVVEKI